MIPQTLLHLAEEKGGAKDAISDRASDMISDAISNGASDAASNAVSDTISNNIPNKITNNVSNSITDAVQVSSKIEIVLVRSFHGQRFIGKDINITSPQSNQNLGLSEAGR